MFSIAQQGIHVGNLAAPESEIEKISRAKEVDMPLKRRNLAPRNQQYLVEVWFQLAHGIVLRGRIVVGDCDEVEPATGRSINRKENRTRNHLSRLAWALSVAMPGVHMEIAAEPRRSSAQRQPQRRWLARDCASR